MEDLIAFSRRFGELDWAPVQETGRRFVDGHPEIYVVSNVMENGEPIGSLGAGEAVWHTDMSYLENPPKASMLYALEIPPTGGDTHFCNMYRAYESLPDALKQRISELTLKHDATYNSGGYVRQGLAAAMIQCVFPGVYHALVCTHPESGRRALYLGRRRNAYVGGMPLADLKRCWMNYGPMRHTMTSLGITNGRPGDVVLWDNRCTMHRRDAFDPKLAPDYVSHANQERAGRTGVRTISAPRIVLSLLCYPVLDPVRGPRKHRDSGASDESGPRLSNTQLGLAFSAFAIPYALFQLVGGWIGDKFGPRLTLSACCAMVGVSTMLTGAARGFVSLFVLRLALGFAEGAAFPTATRAMSTWVPIRDWGFAQGITHSFARIGNAATPPLMAALTPVRILAPLVCDPRIGEPGLASGLGLVFSQRPASASRHHERDLAALPKPLSRLTGRRSRGCGSRAVSCP